MPRPQDSRRRGGSGISRTNSRGFFAEPLCHASVRTLLRATSVLSSEATKLAAQGSRDLASGVLFLDLSACRGHGPPCLLSGSWTLWEKLQQEFQNGILEIINARILEFWNPGKMGSLSRFVGMSWSWPPVSARVHIRYKREYNWS